MTKADERKALRQQADFNSVKALAELLRRVATDPATYDKDDALKTALRTQGALARHVIPELKIHGMSLNHQKTVADLVLGNYGLLDALRKAAADALTTKALRVARGNKNSKSGLLASVRELEDERTQLLEDLYLLQRAYDLRCLQARTYAKAADAATQARCAKEQKELDVSFSLRKKFLDVGKVSSLEEAKNRVRKTT
ncbi:MAG: hypothetical protein AB1720_02155 [Pseudomonadota bacterium]